jgi:hypothetical protein
VGDPSSILTGSRDTGTAAVTQGSAVVTGTNTTFTNQVFGDRTLEVGDKVQFGGATAPKYTILTIDNDLQITLNKAYVEASGSGKTVRMFCECSPSVRVFVASSGPRVVVNNWHTYEVLMTGQSDVGVADGACTIWLDGTQITSYSGAGGVAANGITNIEWFPDCSTSPYFSGMQGFLYWGGGGVKTVNDDYIDIGEFKISGKN